ncbi:hypothetical protein [Nocardioides sp. B-3]|uniref:hypothetical protein n=1 Tax=Nocardioides sp. B-3 TaxID=2895565 RepID=UPI00215283E2|nr:hypothetical protein [Nocardioides sp. B-3]UUZ58008.1 hypothetical protein LP418_16970 [Nocardioides sp. B-3]
MFVVPDIFRSRPFSRGEALEAGITARVLEGVQFTRLHDGVYCHRDHVLTFADRIEAARSALPAEARTTGITRIRGARPWTTVRPSRCTSWWRSTTT